jgi:hypothetical protein
MYEYKNLFKIKISKFAVGILSLNDFSAILVAGLLRSLELLALFPISP